jgi:hypothetical protein
VRQEDEYKRNGTRNLIVLVEVVCPEPEWIIDVVMDNLNTHHLHSLAETFGKAEADRILSRVEFHHTPTHASWLNMAEIELSILSKQCGSRRLPDEWTLTTEIITWEEARNAKKAGIRWTFTVNDARIVFKDHSLPSLTCCTDPRLPAEEALNLQQKRWPVEVDTLTLQEVLGWGGFRLKPCRRGSRWGPWQSITCHTRPCSPTAPSDHFLLRQNANAFPNRRIWIVCCAAW